jgi:hypothetical protein
VVGEGTVMPRYDILAVCNACGDEHPTELSVFLDSGPNKKESVAAVYAKKDLPPNLATLKDIRVYCPRTGRQYAQTNYKQIFLIRSD